MSEYTYFVIGATEQEWLYFVYTTSGRDLQEGGWWECEVYLRGAKVDN